MKYRKRPVVIDAVQWTGTNGLTIAAFMGEPFPDDAHTTDTPIIHTLEGDLTASVGDYIIRGIKGEFYPCRADIFEATYDAVDDEIGKS